MTGVPPQAGSGHSPSGLSQSPLSQAEPSVPNAAFTPGPWTNEPGLFFICNVGNNLDDPGVWSTAIPADGVPFPFGSKEADARLIAAAPELYEAAMTALGLIEPLTAQGEDAIWRPANKAWEALVAATRKARGDQ